MTSDQNDLHLYQVFTSAYQSKKNSSFLSEKQRYMLCASSAVKSLAGLIVELK